MFTANTMQEAVAQVKQDLGREAVILHTRKLRRGGFFGFFGREVIEVMAAIDEQLPTKPVIVPSAPLVQTAARVVRSNDDESAKMTAMQLEISGMRKLLEQMMTQMPKTEKRCSPLQDILRHNDVDEQIAAFLLKGIPDGEETADDPAAQETAKHLLLERIYGYLRKVEGIQIPAVGTKIVALVGPTGVGKTTTVAKLAANFALKEGYRVALITADTYRISAVEQLKTYADILGVPIEIVYSPTELHTAIQRHRDKHLVLIDTAGRSPKNTYQLAELQALLEVDPYIETHLVISIATKYREALDIVDRFSVCSPQKFLFTKFDEAANVGTMLNLLYHFPSSLSYVTTGQNVPDDIELANPGKLAQLLMRD